MERIYETPVMEVLVLSFEDIVTTSGRDEVLPEIPLDGGWYDEV